MPKWLVHVHPRYGTPWVAILVCGLVFTVFSLQAFAFLVVVDVFLQTLVILAEFGALWKLRITRPELPRAEGARRLARAWSWSRSARRRSSCWPSTARSRRKA